MQPRALLILGLAALAVAGAAAAQTPTKKRAAPPVRPAAEVVAVKPKPAPVAPPPLRLGGLVGMSPVGDPGPACRAQCSKDRYVCHAAGDATDCDGRWIPCLHACSVR